MCEMEQNSNGLAKWGNAPPTFTADANPGFGVATGGWQRQLGALLPEDHLVKEDLLFSEVRVRCMSFDTGGNGCAVDPSTNEGPCGPLAANRRHLAFTGGRDGQSASGFHSSRSRSAEYNDRRERRRAAMNDADEAAREEDDDEEEEEDERRHHDKDKGLKREHARRSREKKKQAYARARLKKSD